MNNSREQGMWKRTFGMFTHISVPVWLYLLQAILGVASTKVALSYVPYEAEIKLGNLGDKSNVILYVTFLLLVVASQIAARIPAFYAHAKVTKRLQDKLIHRSLRLPVKSYETKASQIVSWITQDCALADGLLTAIVGFLTGVASVILTVTAMNSTAHSMTYIVVIVAAYILLSTWLEGKLTFLKERRGRRATSELTAYFAEHLGFFTEIKQLHSFKEELVRGKESIKNFFKADIYQANLTLINSFISGAISNMITILVFVLGVREVNRGAMSLADLAAFQNYILIAYQSVSSLPELYVSIMHYNGSLFFISSLMAEKEEVYERKQGIAESFGDVTLDHVSFGYGEETVLDDVTLKIPEGRFTLVTGPNGSGKTTLFKLLERFYTPDKGTLYMGNTPLEDIHLNEWRRNTAYVLQESQLFSGTIRENITYGFDREVTDEELDRAVQLASAYDFIHAFPEGYDYEIGEDGSKLSGGQRQRLSIARAIISDPDILLLDEPTSAMDVRSSKAVIDSLSELMKGRTTVMISHDMKMLERADNVIVFKDGKVEAQGPKDEVIAKSETLRKLIEA